MTTWFSKTLLCSLLHHLDYEMDENCRAVDTSPPLLSPCEISSLHKAGNFPSFIATLVQSPACHITPSYHLNHSVTGVYLLHMKRQKSKQEIQGNKVQSNVPVYVFKRHEPMLLMSGPALFPQET